MGKNKVTRGKNNRDAKPEKWKFYIRIIQRISVASVVLSHAGSPAKNYEFHSS